MSSKRAYKFVWFIGLGLAVGLGRPTAAPAQGAPGSLAQAVNGVVSANKKQANAYLDSASVIVLGSPRGIASVVVDMQKLTAPGSPEREAVLTGKFNLLDAIAYEKARLTDPALSGIREAVIDRTFEQVFGRPSTPLEQAKLDPELRAGKTWYAPLVLKEQAELNGNQLLRQQLVQQVYQRALGRPGSPAEVGYWIGQPADYTALIAAARAWLYSPAGAKDLIETVTRAQQAKGQPVDSTSIKLAMAKSEPGREIYSEMVGLHGMLIKK